MVGCTQEVQVRMEIARRLYTISIVKPLPKAGDVFAEVRGGRQSCVDARFMQKIFVQSGFVVEESSREEFGASKLRLYSRHLFSLSSSSNIVLE
jgi:hypothetical protein